MPNHKLLNKLERRFRRFAIPNLMTILIFGMSIVAMIDIFINPSYEVNLSSILAFDKALILQGQVWRILTFVMIPPGYSILTIAFTLYFYWLLGTALENQWGSFRFNVYYFTGMIGTIIGGMITGYATNYYLNLSLFLAFAMLYPNHQVYLLFMIPIKMKFLAFVDGLFLLYIFRFSDWSNRIALLISIANFLLFFMPDVWYHTRMFFRRIYYKFKRPQNRGGGQTKNWKNHWWNDKNNTPFH